MAILETRAPSPGPKGMGWSMKHVSLIMLTFQNSGLILILHISRIMPLQGDHRYFTSTAVLLNEVIKLAISMTMAIHEVSTTLAPQTPATVIFQQIYNSVFSGDGWKLALPATLYTLQNTLQYVAVENLDPVHFQILYQLKILTTAFFSVVMLSRALSSRRWLALVLLTIGVSIVSLPAGNEKTPPPAIHDFSDHYFPRSFHELGQLAGDAQEVAAHLSKRVVESVEAVITKRSATYQGIKEDQGMSTAATMNYSLGLVAIIVAATISGLNGVYFEKVLKDSPTPVSIWTRNIQLSFYSLFPALLVGVIMKDGEDIAKHGFFEGYNSVVWAAIVCQAAGGVLTSLVIHYADNIAKNFATSISIIISLLISVWLFNFQMNISFFVGMSLVLFATYLYSGSDRKRSRPSPVNIVDYEKTTVDAAPRVVDEKKMFLDPMDSAAIGLSTSRPSTPMLHHTRGQAARAKNRDE